MSTVSASRVHELLLESARVAAVHQVTTSTTDDGVAVVSVRVAVTNVPSLADLPPVLAELRALVREVSGEQAQVFVEADLTEPPGPELPTEAIVIRGAD